MTEHIPNIDALADLIRRVKGGEHPIPAEMLPEWREQAEEENAHLATKNTYSFAACRILALIAEVERLTSVLAEAERERDAAYGRLDLLNTRAEAAVSELAALREGIAVSRGRVRGLVELLRDGEPISHKLISEHLEHVLRALLGDQESDR